MAEIQISVEGKDAIAATTELFAMPEIDGTWEPVEEAERETVLATVGAIVGIVGGSLAIAEQIRKWYKEYQKGKSGMRVEKVLLVGRNVRRLLLENATTEQIKAILDEV
ncbi:MAG: hypothetical protein KME43_00190 [Myxacorys chilensis ATA2-1-KO14]|jgi:hypothetical protein|nr:hypothetical protein [Myxacorys chilensis ATA2-1-KO14]